MTGKQNWNASRQAEKDLMWCDLLIFFEFSPEQWTGLEKTNALLKQEKQQQFEKEHSWVERGLAKLENNNYVVCQKWFTDEISQTIKGD